jgi:hypothetical protein
MRTREHKRMFLERDVTCCTHILRPSPARPTTHTTLEQYNRLLAHRSAIRLRLCYISRPWLLFRHRTMQRADRVTTTAISRLLETLWFILVNPVAANFDLTCKSLCITGHLYSHQPISTDQNYKKTGTVPTT